MAFDAIVVGAGIMGACAARSLARRGSRVLVLDRHGVPNALGSSHGATRVFRLAYYEHPDYVPLLLRARELWRELEQGERRLLLETGGLYLAPEGHALIEGSLESARSFGLDHARLGASEISRRHPQVRVPEGYAGFHEPSCGVLACEAAVLAALEDALRAGARLAAFERARRWRADGEGVEVETDAGTYRAGRLVVCGGPWSGRLLAELRLPLATTRQSVAWLWPPEPEAYASDRMPVCCAIAPGGAFIYTIPMLGPDRRGDRLGFKVACHEPGPAIDPDGDRRAEEPEPEPWREGLAAFLPGALGPTVSRASCVYTSTPDGHFLLDLHPAHPNVAFAAGFSGHGFKFGPVVGEALADLALEGAAPPAARFLGLSRLSLRG